MKLSSLACVCLALSAASIGGGCANEHGSTRPITEAQPQIDVVSANKEVVVGDTTTLTVTSRNTLGHDAQVQWDTTGGRLTTEENGRVARVQFDKPGSYTVNAKLLIDGRVYDQDSVTIEARPLH